MRYWLAQLARARQSSAAKASLSIPLEVVGAGDHQPQAKDGNQRVQKSLALHDFQPTHLTQFPALGKLPVHPNPVLLGMAPQR